MKIHLSHKKPVFSLDSAVHCSFRSSKAYLWGLISERLATTQKDHGEPLHILDAACHALLTRNMFPDISRYYGLDVSSSRLTKAFSLKRPDDILYQADLCHSLSLDGCFDVVVSCNTLSHLPGSQQYSALHNLTNSCVNGGSLLFNCNIDPLLQTFTQYLSSNFSSLEIVYFDSYRSLADEDSSKISSRNIREKSFPMSLMFQMMLVFIPRFCILPMGSNTIIQELFHPVVPIKYYN